MKDKIKNPAIKWLRRYFCKHQQKKEVFRCYQDRYLKEVCKACGKEIYSDL